MVKKRKMTHLFWGFQRYYMKLKWLLGVEVAFVVSVMVVNHDITRIQNIALEQRLNQQNITLQQKLNEQNIALLQMNKG
jgi:hypothetical protein